MRTCSLIDLGLTPYDESLILQRRLATLRAEDRLEDVLLLVEHPPVITLGRAGRKTHLHVPECSLTALGIEFFEVERGGDITYHGPGQLVGYPILNLTEHGCDLHRYLRQLEEVLIVTLSDFGIAAGRSLGRTGVWIGESKIASLGIHVSRWITRHGFALNVNMDLAPFELIVPCGIQGAKATSMRKNCSPASSATRSRDASPPHHGACGARNRASGCMVARQPSGRTRGHSRRPRGCLDAARSLSRHWAEGGEPAPGRRQAAPTGPRSLSPVLPRCGRRTCRPCLLAFASGARTALLNSPLPWPVGRSLGAQQILANHVQAKMWRSPSAI